MSKPPTTSTTIAVEQSAALQSRLMDVIEQDIIPLTERGVQTGNKIFGAAILRRSDWSLVLAATNNEIANPLWHGEMHAIKLLYELPTDQRPDPADCLFVATHEPCTLCLSAIAWGGYNNFYYLFSHEDSRDAFQIGHDLKILKEVFRHDPGGYNRHNAYFDGYSIRDLPSEDTDAFNTRFHRVKARYDVLSATYQASKAGNNIPLK